MWTELLLEKFQTCDNNSEESTATKINKHSTFIHYLHTVHLTGTKTNIIFTETLTASNVPWRSKKANNTINYEKKEMRPLTDEDFTASAKISLLILMIAMIIATIRNLTSKNDSW